MTSDPSPRQSQRPANAMLTHVSAQECLPLLDAIQDLVMVLAPAGTLLYANRKFRETLGYDEEDFGHLGLDALYPSAYRAEVLEAVSEMLNHGVTLTHIPLVSRDGIEFSVETRMERGYWAKEPALMAISRLLSGHEAGRRQSARGPSQRDSHTTAILDDRPCEMWLQDREGHFLAVNQTFAESCGLPDSEVIVGRTPGEVLPPRSAERHDRQNQRMIAEGRAQHIEEAVADQDGQRWLEFHSSPIRNASGEVIGSIGFSRDITERKAMEEELRFTRHQFMTLLDSMDALIYVTDIETNEILFVNRKLKELNTEAEIGKKCWEVMQLGQSGPCEFCTNGILSACAEKASSLPVPNVIWEHFNARSHKWLECRDTLIHWNDERPCRLEVATDITERKRTEQRLRDQVDFENIVMSLSMRFIYQDTDSLDTEIDHALSMIGGINGIDRASVFLFGPHRLSLHTTHEWCAEGIDAGRSRFGEFETSHLPWLMLRLFARENVHIPDVAELPPEADGEQEMLTRRSTRSTLITPMLTNSKRLLGFIGLETVRQPRHWSDEDIRLLRMTADIFANALERQQMLRALRASESRHRSLLKAIPDLMFRLGQGAEILDVTRGHQQRLNANRETLIGARIDCFLDPSQLPLLIKTIAQTLHEGGLRTLECAFDFGQGMETHEVRLSPSGTDEVIAIVRNINERVQLERMRSDFIDDASHELRTPLTTIILMIQLLEAGGSREDMDDYWRTIKAEIDRMQLLIEDLLTISRLQNEEFEVTAYPLTIGDIIELELDNIRPMAATRSIDLCVDLPPEDLPSVLGNDNALRQVFANLLNNAVKFNRPRGLVTLSAEVSDRELWIHIQDTGIGIPESEIEGLFSRFFRASNALENDIQGSGIGLYIIQAMLRALGGRIEVSSTLNEGSRFSVSLRLAEEAR